MRSYIKQNHNAYFAPGHGDGTFGEATLISAGRHFSISAADVNRDGLTDAVLSPNYGTDFCVVLGSPPGGIEPPICNAISGVEHHSATIFAAQVNADDIPDLLIFADGDLYSFLGDETGQFEFEQIFDLPTHTISIAVGDLDGDDISDWVAAGVNALVIQCSGTAYASQTIPLQPQTWVRQLFLEDLNRDGNLDLLAPAYAPNHLLLVLPGQGDGTFADPYYLPTKNYFSITPGQFNFDDWPDLYISIGNSAQNSLLYFNQCAPPTRFGDIDNDFGVDMLDYEIFAICQELSGPNLPTFFDECLDLFDVDLDGDIDLYDTVRLQAGFTGPVATCP